MGKLCQISTESLPLICAENWFQCSISRIFWPITFKLCIHICELIFKRGGLGLNMDKFRQISYCP